jgi:LmbE family N-acetylglucosaminyl deacetylase
MAKIVVVSPHPDDEVIGCGGSLIKHGRIGAEITVITLGERLGCALEGAITQAQYRDEGAAAHRILGVVRHVAFELPARDFMVNQQLKLRLAEEFRRERPDIVYLPHQDEADAEHRQAHEVGLEALWMAQSVYWNHLGTSIKPPAIILGYEVWTPLMKYQYAEDISDVIDAKVEAMRCYKSQLKHGPWDDAIRGLAKYRGTSTQCGSYVEVFAVYHVSALPSGK